MVKPENSKYSFKTRLMTKVRKFFLLTVLFLLFLISGLYIYYKIQYPSIFSKKHFNYSYFKEYITNLSGIYSKEVMLNTGGRLSFPKERLQYFLNFPPNKKPGTIRIGAFGDSHTYGDEVDKDGSYPYQLQELFHKNFPEKNVEVLNFGVRAAGFQEQFFLWKEYAKKYQLDYILLGPRGFYPERDTTFNWWLSGNILPPKARFILSDNKTLKQIHIKGHTLEKRHSNYYRFIPPWIVLRYDRTSFQVWGQLFSFSRKSIYNPFYYKKELSDAEESFQINILLLKKIQKQHPKKILFFTDHYSTYNMYQSVKELYNLNLTPIPQHSLHYRELHESFLGYKLLSKTYFKALLGEKDFFLNPINCSYQKSFKSPNQTVKLPPTLKNLSQVTSINIHNGRNILSSLECNKYTACTYPHLHYKNTANFITFLDPHLPLTNSLLLPLSFPLKEGMKIYIQQGESMDDRFELGYLQALDDYHKFFVFYAKYINYRAQVSRGSDVLESVLFSLEKLPNQFKKNIKSSGKLFVGNHPIGHIKPDGDQLRFIPAVKSLFVIRGPAHSIKDHDLPNEFPLYIQYNMVNGKNFKSLIPDWTCKKQKQRIHLDLPHFEPLKL